MQNWGHLSYVYCLQRQALCFELLIFPSIALFLTEIGLYMIRNISIKYVYSSFEDLLDVMKLLCLSIGVREGILLGAETICPEKNNLP